ncbi:MAG: phosphate signaling complex protein PhoU [Methanoregula sp.]|jgi:phosphate transport system protein
MTEKFRTELALLKHDTIEMARFAQYMLKESIVVLMNEDIPKAAEFKQKKNYLRELSPGLEQRAYQMIAMNQPMAKDMRTIVCTLKIIAAAERIGRYGKVIANMTKHVHNQPAVSQSMVIPQMADQVIGMIDNAISAYKNEDITLIRDFSSRDDVVDTLWHSFFQEMVPYMKENPTTVERGTYYIMVARYLERSGDHACTIAENVRFMISGERIDK